MAVIGSLSAVRAQLAHDPRFTAAFAYAAEALDPASAARQRINGMAAGTTAKIGLSGGAFVSEQAYQPKPRPEGFFESHRKYIDVQVIVEGEELMEVEDVSRLPVSAPYDAERDFIKYADTATASVLRMQAGDVAVYFPIDGHMPSLWWRGQGVVRKAVVKVPVEP